jgi:hypothetical protein
MCRAFFIATFVIAVVVSIAPAAASGTYEIYNFRSNQCLQPVNGSTGQGAAIVQEPCTEARQWWIAPSPLKNNHHERNGMKCAITGI